MWRIAIVAHVLVHTLSNIIVTITEIKGLLQKKKFLSCYHTLENGMNNSL